MAKGKLTKLFPGGNTSKGFFSFYDQIIDHNATRIFILKGGPGVGKSTFMRRIGEMMLEWGYDVEFLCCSSDNNSLDGICIPSLGVAMIDGTAPHVVDPKIPGAVDEIINLGEFWNEDKIFTIKQTVLQSKTRVGRLFRIAYHQLAEARLIKDELDSYLVEATNQVRINETARKIIKDVLENAPVQFEIEPKARHLFATAFTPQGQQHHLDTILQDVKKLYLVTGEATGLTSRLVGYAARAAYECGLDTHIFHCPLEPDNIDLVVIPQQDCAVLKDIPGIKFQPQEVSSIEEIKIFNINEHLDKKVLIVYDGEIKSARNRLEDAVKRAINYIAQAKAEHDLLESYYIPAMNFEAISAKRDEILARILKYVRAPGS
ncbi:MAG: PRK06851 family protein [Desulfotomaculaceae bacterium]|nr:PRK06851 family protein [Desulfotomaculaceae bacterium]